MRLLVLVLALLTVAAARAASPIPVRVVVVTTFEVGADTGDTAGEFQNWVEHLPLPQKLPFPQGYHELRYNPDLQVLGMITGEGKSHAAASIMGLGMDPRFDLSHAYWIMAGIAGIDPAQGSVGSAAWANYIVDGDLANEIDAREIPPDWPTGIVPFDRASPFEAPAPARKTSAGEEYFRLNAALTDWAFDLTKTIALPDTEALQKTRAGYPAFPNASRPPFVMKGDTITADHFWIGARMNEWAERWVSYWTQGKATMVTSAEEDIGYAQALSFLAQAGKVDFNRVLDLRTASDFTTPPEGKTVVEQLASEAKGDYPAYDASIAAAYLVGSPVVREIALHWDTYGGKSWPADR